MMRRQTNLGKKFGKILLMAALSVGCALGAMATQPTVPAFALSVSANGTDAANELSAYCNNLKTKNKPDQYTSQKLDSILNGAVSYLKTNPGIDYSDYLTRVQDQMDAVLNSTVAAGDTASYLFLADNFTIPTVKYGETVTIPLPVINYSDAQLTDVVINPNMESVATDDFPFEIQNSGYTQLIKAIPPYNPDKDILSLRQDLVYTFTVRQDVQTG